MGQSIGEIIINIKNEKKQTKTKKTKGKTIFSQPRKSLHREKENNFYY